MCSKPVVLIPLVLFGLLAAAPAAAQAQLGPPPLTRSPRPVTSPYLNLLDGMDAGEAAFQYYRRVLPEVELRQSAQQLQQSARQQSAALQGLRGEMAAQRMLIQSPTSALGTTGHPTSFFNYGGYFNSPGGGSQAMLGAGGLGMGGQPAMGGVGMGGQPGMGGVGMGGRPGMGGLGMGGRPGMGMGASRPPMGLNGP